ncbi:hypothetical protein Ccrd_018461 [Cynara cardunculus var. scolymus]|uniref:Uncharacterized protein n=1 Tax=Cynara cardunculus var. scolymus TaxID=59895 RepID=A0A118K1R2_CYNCS|nr:hypothetical protein Ccrd_018461 [Cynara cardunculus var. scolymus]
MPPKQQPKADLAKKQKIIEDKTFGLRNRTRKKKKKKAKEKELNDLLNIVVSQPKVPVIPNLYYASFIKLGNVQRVFSASSSHNLDIQRKGEKIDLYIDQHDHGDNAFFLFSLALCVLFLLM